VSVAAALVCRSVAQCRMVSHAKEVPNKYPAYFSVPHNVLILLVPVAGVEHATY
jgi:hypothetical protein